MKVEVKFKPKDEVFFMHNDKIVQGTVLTIGIVVRSYFPKPTRQSPYSIEKDYTIKYGQTDYIHIREDYLFGSKEELFKHLSDVCDQERKKYVIE